MSLSESFPGEESLPAWICEAETQVILAANPAAAELVGYEEAELRGRRSPAAVPIAEVGGEQVDGREVPGQRRIDRLAQPIPELGRHLEPDHRIEP